MQPNAPTGPPGRQSPRAPTKKRRRRGALTLRTVGSKAASTRYDSRIFTARFRRLLPLDPRDLATIHRWYRERIRWNKRASFKYGWYYGSIRLRTLGPLYESKIVDSDDNDEWTSQWSNLGIVNAKSGVSKSGQTLIEKLDEKLDDLDIRLESRAAYLSEVKIEFFNLKGGEPSPDSSYWKTANKKVRNL